MTTWTRKAVALLALSVMIVVFGASSVLAQDAGTTSSGDKLTFTVGLTSDMVSANPFKACCGSEYEMMFLNYDMLYNFSQQTLEATDGLGTWPPEVSEDGKTYTIHIRDDAKWSDGQPVTARDVAFTFNFIKDNEGTGSFNNYIGDPESFEAVDDTTFVWTMKKATPIGPNTPAWVPILPEHIWSKYDGLDAKAIKEVRNVPAVGSGPFHLVEWKEGEFFRMEANKDYWGGAPTIDEVVFRIYDDQESLKLALQGGEIDFAEALTPSTFNQLKSDPNIETHVASQSYLDNLAFNFEGTANPALHDEKVRLAIAYSIDKQAIVDRVMLGNGLPGDSIVLPIYTKWYKAYNGTPDEIGYDPAKAKALLAEAGWKDTDNDGIVDKDGQPLQLEILEISDVTYSVAEGQLIAGWMKDIGIDAKERVVSETKAYDVWGAQDFDMYIWGWGGDPDPDFMASIFTKDQCLSWSDGCYSDPGYEKLYTEQASLVDEAAREAKIAEIQDWIYTKNPEIVLAYEADLQAWRKDKWEGLVYQPEPNGSAMFSFGPYSYMSVHPVGQAASASGTGPTGTTDSGGTSPVIWIVIGGAALVVVIGVLLMRRGRSDQDTE